MCKSKAAIESKEVQDEYDVLDKDDKSCDLKDLSSVSTICNE